MTHLRLNLLGTFLATLDGKPIAGFESDKERALLAYLAVEGDRPHRRETLAGLLWPDMTEGDARANLRHVLAHLRRILQDRETDNPILTVTRQTIQFNKSSGIDIDVHTFADAVAATASHTHASTDTCEVCISHLQQAVKVYQGAFLEGFSLDSDLYEEWMVVQREKLHIQLLDALEHLAVYYEGKGEYGVAQGYAQRQVELEPWRESAHRQLMRLYALSGQRGRALAQYETCRRVLQEELGIEPKAETTTLYNQIRRDELQPTSPVLIEAKVQEPAAAPSVPAEVETTCVPQTPTRLEGERRMVTALTAILKETTVQPGDVDLESWAEMMHVIIPVLRNEVQSFEGEVYQVREDRLLVLYGLTAAHEDDPERAVLTAFSMRDAFQVCAANLPLAVSLHIGVSTGEVIATPTGHHQNMSSALGQVTRLAERMAEAAEPGTVLVAEYTYRLVEPLFEWEMLGRFQVRGIPTPVGVSRPLSHKGGQDKGRGIAGLSSPLVGREEEMQALEAAVGNLRRGMGGIVTVVGEAGIGKSRLVTEVKSWSLGSGNQVDWLEGRCLSYTTNVAYQVWMDLLRTWLDRAGGTTPENTADILQKQVREICPDNSDDIYPFLLRLLSLPLDEWSLTRLQGIDAGGIQVLTCRAVETLFASICQQQSMVLVCEDLHWADSTSLSLLEYLMPLADQVPLLLVCVMRPVTEHDCWHVRELASRDYPHRHTDLWLKPLSSIEGETLVGNLLWIEDLSVELRNRILEHAEGNPFYLEEILRSLIEDEAIIYDTVTDPSTGLETGHWVATGESEDLRIPDTLRGVLTARIDRLETGTKRVLQLASVIGRVFSYKVLAAVADSAGADEMNSHLVSLQRAGLIRERARLPEREYIFKHVLTQEAAYHRLLRKERHIIHRKVAEGMERLYPEKVEEQLGLLAYHWEQADDREKAVHYLRQAGEQAASQYANAEAVDYFSRALIMASVEDTTLRYDLLLSRERVYDLQGKRELQAQDLRELTKLAEALDVEAPQPGKSRRAEIGLRQMHLAIRTGKYGEAEQVAPLTLQQAQESNDKYAEATTYREWGRALFYLTNLLDSLTKAEQALTLARKAGFRDVEIASLRTLGANYLAIDNKKAQPTFEQELKICQEDGFRILEGVALLHMSRVYLDQRDYATAMEYAKASLRVCREIGNRRDEGWALYRIGEIYFHQDRKNHIEAENYAMQAKTIFHETQDATGLANVYFLLARSAQDRDDDTIALNYYQQALDIFRKSGSRRHEITSLLNLGWFLLVSGQYAEAQRFIEQSYLVADDSKIRGFQGAALNNLGWLYFTMGHYDCAQSYAEESLSITRENIDIYWECECLLMMGFIAYATGNDEQALKHGQQAQRIAQEYGHMDWQWLGTLIQGHALTGLGNWDAAVDTYSHAIDLLQESNLFPSNKTEKILETKASLSRLKLLRGDHVSSLALVEDMVQYLQEKPELPYTQQPFRVYLTCIQVLEVNHDPRAQEILEQAHTLLQERAATIEDEDLHRSYLENVAENREIIKLWECMDKGET